MKKILIILFLLPLCSIGQRGFHFVDKSIDVDERYEKIIKDTICETCVFNNKKNKYIPTVYNWVEYNYGEPPPEYTELVKSYLTNRFPDTIRGWVVTDTLLISYGGDCYFGLFDLKMRCINKINNMLPMYVYRMAVSISGCGGRGEQEEFSIRIWASDEEMKRRRSEIYKE